MSFPTLSEIVDALQANPLRVAERYAPGGRIDKGKYWALNPMRQDKSIGTFHVNLTGAYAGRYHDYATSENGDMLDLIQHALGLERPAALAEARAFLGMDNETAAQKQLRERQAAKARHAQEDEVEKAKIRQKKAQGQAQALFIRSADDLADTPVAHYLAGRAIGVKELGRAPGCLRFNPDMFYKDIDKDTGEIIEGRYPAMIAAIYGPAVDGEPSEFYGIHRTYLGRRADGSWGKADVPKAKKVYGRMKGGYIRVWSGAGPRGGIVPLSKAPPGSTVFMSEGIEDALSAAILHPNDWAIAAISLGNLSEVILPRNIATVVIVADNDPLPEQAALVERAHLNFLKQGRASTVWRNSHGGKDLNDALMARMKFEQQQEKAGAA